jgi:UDP-N-acetylglucosamine 4,6-dehydratase
VLREFHPKKLIVFSRDELKQHEMRIGGFDDERLRYFIGDVRDVSRLRRAMNGVDIVVHAAALKQVPACEYNPIEAVATNVDGAKNVIDAALDMGVYRILALSTDKAVSPANLYGATKLVAEKLFTQANVYAGTGPTRFACVRYGNVIGSRGSVVPLFREQLKSGTVTVTDPRMTRFWITLEDGVRFVIGCIEKMHGGEVFVPKLPSTNIIEVAQAMAPHCTVKCIGIRPGEKLHECLVSEDEARHARDAGSFYVVLPGESFWKHSDWSDALPVEDGFRYASDTNLQRLSIPEIREMIGLPLEDERDLAVSR